MDTGRRIRGDGASEDNEEGASTETPVLFGDRGDAIMGAGIVRLLRWVAVRYGSIRVVGKLWGGV